MSECALSESEIDTIEEKLAALILYGRDLQDIGGLAVRSVQELRDRISKAHTIIGAVSQAIASVENVSGFIPDGRFAGVSATA